MEASVLAVARTSVESRRYGFRVVNHKLGGMLRKVYVNGNVKAGEVEAELASDAPTKQAQEFEQDLGGSSGKRCMCSSS
jgi:hypothetical protein